jgi:hypothetical protein
MKPIDLEDRKTTKEGTALFVVSVVFVVKGNHD